MTQYAKPRLHAVVTIRHRGTAEVRFPARDLSGRIERRGVQDYEAFGPDGALAGRAARYESSARLLAGYLGLTQEHLIDVEIVHAWETPRGTCLDG